MIAPSAENRRVHRPGFAGPDEARGVVLADLTTGRASLFPHSLERSTSGTAWSLLRAICTLNPNIVLASMTGEQAQPGLGHANRRP